MGTSNDADVLKKRLAELVTLQEQMSSEPYSIPTRLDLALKYKSLGYPDLAAGDAYKALLLVDEIVDEGEYFGEVMEAAKADVASIRHSSTSEEHLYDSYTHMAPKKGEVDPESDDDLANWARTHLSSIAYELLIECLIDCGCLRSAFDFISRAIRSFPSTTSFKTLQGTLMARLESHFKAKGESLGDADVEDYPERGLVRRELYPWSNYEPDRLSDESVQFLNKELASIAPKLEVKVSTLPLLSFELESSRVSSIDSQKRYVKQLGVFAKEEIPPGEQILQERSLLTAISRLHEAYCDACSRPFSKLGNSNGDSSSDEDLISCDECDVIFCSTECHDLAQDSYHPPLCGVDIEQKVPASEAADSLYSLLLIRALALAETQQIHPLELKEVRYIWGDYHNLDLEKTWQAPSQERPFSAIAQTLPFSFNSNVVTPLHILEKMEVNIFEQSHRYDNWVFNSLYAKFRGTASAKQGLDGRPEIGAVHPMWCLANHSCDPNVRWEWEGSMKFWTREGLIDWKGRDSSIQPGIRKGEEVFSHYCDIRLPVKERREWAEGALGGECQCPRCIWEAT